MNVSRPSSGGRRQGFGWTPIVLGFFALCFCALTVFGWKYLEKAVHRDARTHFEDWADRISLEIEHAFDLHSRALFSVEGLFAASQFVEPDEFQSFVRALDLEERLPGIFSMAYVARVPPDQVEAFTREMRETGAPDFEINPPGASGDRYVAKYAYDSESGTSSPPTGFDIASDVARFSALMAARDSGSRAVTSPVILRSGGGNRLGFLVYQPVYTGGDLPQTEEARRERLTGAAVVAFKADLFFHVALAGLDMPGSLAVFVRDVDATVEHAQVFGKEAVLGDGAALKTVRTAMIADRRWEIVFSAPNTFALPPLEIVLPWFFLVGSSLFSLLLVFFLHFLMTSRERALRTVARRTAELRGIIEQLPVGVFLAKAPTGEPIMVNRKNVELIGREPDLKSGRESYAETYRVTREDGASYPTEELPLSITLRTGQPVMKSDIFVQQSADKRINLRVYAAPIKDEQGRLFSAVAVSEDRTEEYELERQKSEFIFIASHQLRTPLTAIKWFIEMLLNGDDGPMTAEQAEHVRMIFESNERMITLVNDLLNVSRVESGTIEVAPVETDLVVLANGIVQELVPLMREKRQQFESSLQKLPALKVDPKLVRHALMNLLSNAVKYTPVGGRVSLAARVVGEEVEFSVIDSGIGIPKDQQKRIFQKFFRADNAIASEVEGTGLGLYVCKLVVELSGGRIWFASASGRGTEFRFTLPLKGTPIKKGTRTLN